MTTLYQQHVEKWRDGCGSCICSPLNKVVLARGTIPCDILFIGEAPGDSENAIGQPFVGPAGHLLDEIIRQAVGDGRIDPNVPSMAFTNLVGCFPREEKEAGINEPPTSAIKQCAHRLDEFVGICKPRLVVMVGKLAERWVPQCVKNLYFGTTKIIVCSITHPAAILRANVAQRGLAIQRCVVTISNAVEGIQS